MLIILSAIALMGFGVACGTISMMPISHESTRPTELKYKIRVFTRQLREGAEDFRARVQSFIFHLRKHNYEIHSIDYRDRDRLKVPETEAYKAWVFYRKRAAA